jgi:hypothetical protein
MRSNTPGIKHELNEELFKPEPFVAYYKRNIVESIKNCSNIKYVSDKKYADYCLSVNLKHFDATRTPSSSFIPCLIVSFPFLQIPMMIGGHLLKESYKAEIETIVILEKCNYKAKSKLCKFNIIENNEYIQGMVLSQNPQKGYENAIQPIVDKSITAIISNLSICK